MEPEEQAYTGWPENVEAVACDDRGEPIPEYKVPKRKMTKKEVYAEKKCYDEECAVDEEYIAPKPKVPEAFLNPGSSEFDNEKVVPEKSDEAHLQEYLAFQLERLESNLEDITGTITRQAENCNNMMQSLQRHRDERDNVVAKIQAIKRYLGQA